MHSENHDKTHINTNILILKVPGIIVGRSYGV